MTRRRFFPNELEKDADFYSAAARLGVKGVSKLFGRRAGAGLRLGMKKAKRGWMKIEGLQTPGRQTGIQNALFGDLPKNKAKTTFTQKLKNFGTSVRKAPQNMLAESAINTRLLMKNPLGVLKAEGRSIRDTFKNKGVLAGTGKTVGKLMGGGAMGGIGMLGMNKAFGMNNIDSAKDAAKWMVAPSYAMTEMIGQTAYDLGSSAMKAKKQQKLTSKVNSQIYSGG